MIVVANSGTHPEPMHIACGLIDAGEEVVYATSSSWSRDSLPQRISRHPLLSRTWLARNLRRRELPRSIGRRHVMRAALWQEIQFQIYVLRQSPRRTKALRRRVAKFEAVVGAFVGQHEVDAVFCQYMGAETIFSSVGNRAPKILGYPIAHHRWMELELGDEAKENPDWAPFLQGHDYDEEFLAKLDREVEMADVILVPSSFVRRTFMENSVPPEKVIVVPLAATIPESQGADRTYPPEGDMLARPLHALFAGQVTQRKGISYALEAVSAVPEVQLTIVGSPMPGIVDKIKGFRRVTLIPSQPRDALVRTMESADVLVLPSLAEGFPLVAIEAMSCGTPCIISRSTFAEDVIEDGVNGVLVDARDADQIASALRHFIHHPAELRRMGTEAQAAAKMFTWTRFEHQTTAVITKAIGDYSGAKRSSRL